MKADRERPPVHSWDLAEEATAYISLKLAHPGQADCDQPAPARIGTPTNLPRLEPVGVSPMPYRVNLDVVLCPIDAVDDAVSATTC